jgi:hypothetical protein
MGADGINLDILSNWANGNNNDLNNTYQLLGTESMISSVCNSLGLNQYNSEFALDLSALNYDTEALLGSPSNSTLIGRVRADIQKLLSDQSPNAASLNKNVAADAINNLIGMLNSSLTQGGAVVQGYMNEFTNMFSGSMVDEINDLWNGVTSNAAFWMTLAAYVKDGGQTSSNTGQLIAQLQDYVTKINKLQS